MAADELAYVDAVGQADLVRSGTCTPADLVEGAAARIRRLNPLLNALVHESLERAMEEAQRAALPDGPLRGVPFAFKDVLGQTAGDPYHAGMRLLQQRRWTAQHDSYLAADLRRAGLVFVGRTNVPELAGSVTTEPLAYGPTRNPWSTGHSAGGSSGGSAAAVAAGLVPAAHGNDMGGSIRLPASQCGLVGLKPSRGRTSTGPDFNDYWSGSTHEGVLTRSVRDTAAFLDVMAVPHPGDYFVAPPPSASFSALMAREPGRLRIGLRTDLPGSGRPAHPDHVRAAESVARLLEDMGHRLEAAWPGALDEPEVETLQYQLIGVAFARELDRWGEVLGMPVTADDVEPNTWRFAEMGRPSLLPPTWRSRRRCKPTAVGSARGGRKGTTSSSPRPPATHRPPSASWRPWQYSRRG